MTVSRESVDAMTRILSIMNGDAPPAPAPARAPSRQGVPSAMPIYNSPPIGPSDSDKQQMAEILARFHAATDGSVKRLVTESRRDPSLREALDIELVTGSPAARIGNWKIAAVEQGNRKTYDVTRADDSGERIAQDLTLYEAALALVRMLNQGKAINSSIVLELLRDEQTYASALHDAVLFKRRLNEDRDSKRKQVFEARYSEARARAVQARERIKKRVADIA